MPAVHRLLFCCFVMVLAGCPLFVPYEPVQQAEEAGLSLEDELRHLVLHGLLHLLGYEHESDEDDAAMRAREEAVLGPEIHVSGGHDLHA